MAYRVRKRLAAGMVVAMAGAGAVALAAPIHAQAAGHQYTVTMANMSYGLMPGNLKVGDTIVWVNRDTVPHTVTARDHSFDLRIAPRQSARMTLQKAGSFPFFCIYHAEMRGTLKVAAG
jgi:plastocyanin